MRKIFIAFLFVLIGYSLFAQDSIQKPVLFIRPYFENGIDFIRNDLLKQNYGTQSMYYMGIGIQLGNPNIQKIIPYAQFNYSSFEIVKEIAPNTKADSALTNKQVSGGLMIPFKKYNDIFLKARIGFSYSMIEESFYNIDSGSNGFHIGIGVERKLIGNSRIYLELIYNYQKTGKSQFRDFDATKLSLGLVI